MTVKAGDEKMKVDPSADTAKTGKALAAAGAAAGAVTEVPHTCMLATDMPTPGECDLPGMETVLMNKDNKKYCCPDHNNPDYIPAGGALTTF